MEGSDKPAPRFRIAGRQFVQRKGSCTHNRSLPSFSLGPGKPPPIQPLVVQTLATKRLPQTDTSCALCHRDPPVLPAALANQTRLVFDSIRVEAEVRLRVVRRNRLGISEADLEPSEATFHPEKPRVASVGLQDGEETTEVRFPAVDWCPAERVGGE
uniref:Uncharacterized protein n=1 Tax=Mycena chlorophos TaxID=658473 RepID=A0ABQ0KYS0_MYCCL|nr:predicted protein [Mycena chlorophos]